MKFRLDTSIFHGGISGISISGIRDAHKEVNLNLSLQRIWLVRRSHLNVTYRRWNTLEKPGKLPLHLKFVISIFPCYTITMKSYYIKIAVFILVAAVIFSLPIHAQTEDTFTLQEKIKIYRQILKQEQNPQVLAETHYKIAEFLEMLGRDTEATAEYLKIILNYPRVTYFSKKAEERLAVLYGKFKETPEITKDPAIFFTYIKSLYETYRDRGKYDKAVYLLKKLIKLHPSNQAYYLDIGNIYLNGYNDADTALKYFNKLVELNPEHPSVYTDIGLAYEKKDDFESAIKYYRKSVEISPLNAWSMYGLLRMQALKLAKEKKLIKDWHFLGPFDNTDRKGLEKDFGPEDKIEDLNKVYNGLNGVSIKWFRLFSYGDSGYVDLNRMFEPNDSVVAYALTYAYSEKERNLEIRLGSDDGICVWFNDELKFKKDVLRPAQFDKDIIEVRFIKGWNKILIKTAENWGSWGFYFRITDLNGNTPGDVTFDPLKDDARVKKIYARLKRQKGIKIARTTLFYGFTLLILSSGIYLLISNIYNKIKIRQMKEDFISSVSHELKTPLAAIKMFTETLNMGRVKSEKQIKEYYATIIRETDRLTRFINKILDFQKIEKGKKIYSFENVSIKNLLASAIDIYKDQVQDEGLVVEEECPSDLPEIEVDEDAMLQVLLNLLTNAYKYSKVEKYIKVKARAEGNFIFISVIDRGMGISKDRITKIFDKFYRVDRDSAKDIKGSGIGLAFVKSVVEAHNGEIAVESQLNKGSTFTISLPIKREG